MCEVLEREAGEEVERDVARQKMVIFSKGSEVNQNRANLLLPGSA